MATHFNELTDYQWEVIKEDDKYRKTGHISTWRGSGWSRPAYCKENGLTYPTFRR